LDNINPMSPQGDHLTILENRAHPFRRAVLGGLAVVMPPLLTIVIFVWVGSTVQRYLLKPVESGVGHGLVWAVHDIRDVRGVAANQSTVTIDGRPFQRVADDNFVPQEVYLLVKKNPGPNGVPHTAWGVYHRYVKLRYLPAQVVVPVFLCIFILLLYLLGKFLAAGVGRFFWHTFERGVHRLPLVRNVYAAVKQVTDFLFSEREIAIARVIAVEYPRKGIWSLGLVTNEGMIQLRDVVNEPVLTVLLPHSPVPMTGFTITVKKSETIDLNITIDQAFQFIASCGVVVPPHQLEAFHAAELEGGNGQAIKETAAPALQSSRE
jgi:uncharacterized membrane protein